MSVAPILKRVLAVAARDPERDALVFPGETVSYGRLAAGAAAAAADLLARGVRPGDRVLLSAGSRGPAFAYGYLAAHGVGAIAVPFDPMMPASAREEILRQTRPRASLSATSAPRVDAPASWRPKRVELGAPADILFTSGSTGLPKGVVQTHRNVLAFIEARNAAVGCRPGDRLVLPLPLSHGYALGRLRAALYAGACVILIDGFLFPGGILEAFERLGGASFCCVPAGFAALSKSTGDELGRYADRIRYVESATAPLPEGLRDWLLRLLPRSRVFNSYGLTETTSSIAFVDLARVSEPRRASVGRPNPGTRVRIVGGGGESAPRGVAGTVWIKGPSVMKGYWGGADRKRASVAGGWYETADAGFLDSGGYLFLLGRRDELINVGGLKAAPAEIEAALKSHPGVADCACVGAPDPSGVTGQVVKAFVVPAPGADPSDAELTAWLRARLEAYKVPRLFARMERLPRTPVGKLQRGSLASGSRAET